MGFVANFIRFPAMQKFWKSVNIWQSYRELEGGNFFWDTVYIVSCNSVCWVHLCVFIKLLFSSLYTMLIVNKHCSNVCCDEFPVPQIDHTSKQVKEQWRRKFYLQPVRKTNCYLNTKNIKICVCIFSTSAEYRQKIWILNFPR